MTHAVCDQMTFLPAHNENLAAFASILVAGPGQGSIVMIMLRLEIRPDIHINESFHRVHTQSSVSSPDKNITVYNLEPGELKALITSLSLTVSENTVLRVSDMKMHSEDCV